MRIYFLLIPLLVMQSCLNTKSNISNEELSSIIEKNTLNYYKTNDKVFLSKSYNALKRNKDFREKGLSVQNYQIIVPIFLQLKKYKELEILLSNNKTLNKYYKTTTLNLIKFLNSSNKNKTKANTFIQENIKIIKDSIKLSEKDSVLYTDYFLMKLYLNGRKKTLQEVDSMQKVNDKFSNIFYEQMLRSFIKSFPNDELPTK